MVHGIIACEYDDKRSSSRLGPVQCRILDEHIWKQFRGTRLKNSGGSPEQYKHPCLLPDPQFESRFQRTAGLDIARTA